MCDLVLAVIVDVQTGVHLVVFIEPDRDLAAAANNHAKNTASDN